MKTVLFLFICLVLTAAPLMFAHASEAAIAAEVQAVDQATADTVSDKKSLFEGRCQMCHQLPEPTMLKPKQWQLILNVMLQRMQQAGVPPLTESETEMILEYIAEQSD